ncbi:Zn-dependent hydrolase [Roseisolibacter sp. H3M3-2]|uniref:Zn-dependent hydrolase n=1 Tax=Roseisolibacter sp. H3M3-2 TaxID=3031323 RepID=UPI0023DA10A6|nr:Zn-dependent hydrolase [Roseisolibacter sp. H3M3-2]MDF1501696.1 Zn-dependent hydrolase [Roseisolibacter sp. H3M3-2]
MSGDIDRRAFSATLLGAAAASLLPSDRRGADLGGAQPAQSAQPTAALRVDGARLNRQLQELSRFGRNERGGVDRVAYSDADRDARAYVTQLMRDARLEPGVDAAGNIIGRRAGREASRKPILFGSHVDSVPDGGNYDGPVGSLAAIEVARTLAERGVSTRHPLEVTIWQNEEGGLYGSTAVALGIGEKELANVSRSGKTVADGIRFLGGDPARLAAVRRRKGDVAGYLELHIEQGGTLDAEQVAIGVVEGIVGIGQWEVTVTGFANHAGTTPMPGRQDALLAAARFVELVNRVVTTTPGRQVGTVGRMQAFPGAPNVIPGRVVCTLELRDLDGARIEALYARIRTEADAIAMATGTTFAYQPLHTNIPAPSDPRVRALIAEAARGLGLSSKVLPSGAGHDAQAIAQLGPMGMIFIPSVGGISHSPKEFSRPDDITNGANVLLHTLLKLDAGLPA